MKSYTLTLLNLDDNKEFQINFEAENLDMAWLKTALFCEKLNSECIKLELKLQCPPSQ